MAQTTGNPQDIGALPSTVTDAVLVPSNEMPEGSQKVEELDFNKFAGRPITVDDLMSGMKNMGFQASSIGEAVRIINNMVRSSFLLLFLSTISFPAVHRFNTRFRPLNVVLLNLLAGETLSRSSDKDHHFLAYIKASST